jgi:hypothetical protein
MTTRQKWEIAMAAERERHARDLIKVSAIFAFALTMATVFWFGVI